MPVHSPPPKLNFKEHGTFPHTTLVKRMPMILAQAIQQVEESGKGCGDAGPAVMLLGQLQREMATDGPITTIDDGGPDVSAWNAYIETAAVTEGATTWLSSPWLLAECYMYRRIVAALRSSPVTAELDPFRQSKEGSFTHAISAIHELSVLVSAGFPGSAAQQFGALMHMSLWGNKMDLSLHADALSTAEGGEALRSMQSKSIAHLEQLKPHILCDDTDAVWAKVDGLIGARVDVVLDNAGYELFTDLCLAHWLTGTGRAGRVVWHTKVLPWFVSDASNADIEWMVRELAACEDATVAGLGKQFLEHLASGRWELRGHTFWTLPHEFAAIGDVAPDLKADIDTAALVLLKGDLNYRKLLADRDWLPTTPFADVAGSFSSTTMCALRTLKANLVCGLEPGVAERAAAIDPEWQVKGIFGVIQAVTDR